MKWLKRVILAVVALIGAAAGGWDCCSPPDSRFSAASQIAAPPAKVYPLIADPRQWKTWAIWNQRDSAMQIQYSGPESGTGAKWSWQSKTEGNGIMEFTAATPNEGIKYSLSFPDFGMTSRGRKCDSDRKAPARA